jgi:ABC-type branched-subunit amino acid transport system substrate-binding protein
MLRLGRVIAMLVLVAGGVVAVALTGQAGTKATGLPSTIKIGMLTSLSGTSGGSCTPEANAVRLAAHRAEHARFFGKGVHIQIVNSDDRSSQDGAISGYRDLISQGVVAILGPCLSTNAQTLSAQSDSTHMPEIINLVSAPEVVLGHKYMFQGTPGQTTFAQNTIKVLKARGIKTVAVIHTTDNPDVAAVWNSDWQPQLKRDKIQVVGDFPIQNRPVDLSSIIAQIQNLHPDAIGLDTLGAITVSYVSQIRQAGLKQPIFGQIIMAYPVFYGNATASSAGGAYYDTDYDPMINNPNIKAFTNGWRAENGGADPAPSAAEGYNGAWRLFRAIKSAKSVKADAIQAALTAQKSTVDVAGKVTYSNEGKIAHGTGYVIFLQDGKKTVQKIPTECC